MSRTGEPPAKKRRGRGNPAGPFLKRSNMDESKEATDDFAQIIQGYQLLTDMLDLWKKSKDEDKPNTDYLDKAFHACGQICRAIIGNMTIDELETLRVDIEIEIDKLRNQ
jgi:hypothetical protein